MDATSVSLLRRLNNLNDKVAWERFVDLHAPLIFHWGKSRGLTATDAAELVQEVLATLVTKLPEFQYDPSRRFRGWLYTLASNKARDLHRRNDIRPKTEHDALRRAVETQNATDRFVENEYRGFLARRALELMRREFPDETWQAVWSYVVEGVKPTEVAKQLGVSTNWVYLAKSRVLGRLRDELEGLLD